MKKNEIEMQEILKVLLPNESLSDVLANIDRLVSEYEKGGCAV